MFKFLTVWCVECEPRAPPPCAQRPPSTRKAEATAPPNLTLACAPFVSVIVKYVFLAQRHLSKKDRPHPIRAFLFLASSVWGICWSVFLPGSTHLWHRELVRPHVCG